MPHHRFLYNTRVDNHARALPSVLLSLLVDSTGTRESKILDFLPIAFPF